MRLKSKQPQKSRQLELPLMSKGEARRHTGSGEAVRAARRHQRSGIGQVMEAVLATANIRAAMKQVIKNRGSPGVDGVRVNELEDYWKQNGKGIAKQIRAGRYRPQPVRLHEIPKAKGGTRMLGIPTVLDRMLQQAVLQVLQPLIDPSFSSCSYGFRPRRNAHQALHRAMEHMECGRTWVVDLDLEAFFDRVNHDVLMGKLANRIEDKQLLKLIRGFLEAGMMRDGVLHKRVQGTPQGGPLSPFLANILLDEIDKTLEARGHAFVRYADDLNVFVRSRRSAERVLEGLRKQLGRLRLKVNEDKTKIVFAKDCVFLGFRVSGKPGGGLRWLISRGAQSRMRDRVRQITRRNRGRDLKTIITELRSFLLGWKAYYGLARTPSTYKSLDGWIRRRLRAYLLRQWAHGTAIKRHCRALGLAPEKARVVAGHAGHWWRGSRLPLATALDTNFFRRRGLPSLSG